MPRNHQLPLTRRKLRRPALTYAEILGWADGHHRRTGKWPTMNSGKIHGTLRETWRRVDSCLRLGLRGLPGGVSLARFLAERRHVRNHASIPPLSIAQILAWADDHFRRTGDWPRETSGKVRTAPGETWLGIDRALRIGIRSIARPTSLARLLEKHRGVRNIQALPPLKVSQILAWADAHRAANGAWPTSKSGPVNGISGQTWSGVNAALRAGRRGLPGGSSLPRVLAKLRGVRNPKDPPALSHGRIWNWARDHHRRHGELPAWCSGPVERAPGETWAMIDRALRLGKRGLSGSISLARLLGHDRRFRRRDPHRLEQ
jgi:hypothetical protein